MQIQTVQDLIDKLNEVEDKTKPVFAFVTTDMDEQFDVVPIIMVDNDISDRVDINIHIETDQAIGQ
jgi:hypothetical protein